MVLIIFRQVNRSTSSIFPKNNDRYGQDNNKDTYKLTLDFPIFIAKKYLWPETVTGGCLIESIGAEDV